jgi:basic membrane protein A
VIAGPSGGIKHEAWGKWLSEPAATRRWLRDTDPDVRLLSNFSGEQDDHALSRRIALAEVEAGADIVFTMLNNGREGVTQVCREKEMRQSGNVIDWVAVAPLVLVASAQA